MIKNSDFLAHLLDAAPNGSSVWWNAFVGDPDSKAPWGGQRYIPDQSDVDSLVERNTYYSVAALKPINGEVKRRNEFFDRLLVLVADDPDITKLNGEPSFIIETSHGNYQVGLFISEDDTDAANINAVSGLLSAMTNVGLMKADTSGNNAVRYCRLPVGQNQKPKHGAFKHRLVAWNPENQYTLIDAADVFGVSFETSEQMRSLSSSYEPQDSKLMNAVHEIIHGNALHENINRLSGSLIASGLNDGATTNIVRAIVNQSSRKVTDYKTWQVRYEGIPKSVSGASKFKQVQQDQHQISAEYQYKLDKLKPVEFVIDGFISNKITVIAGPPGVGKTSLLVPLSFHAAHLCAPDAELKPSLRRRVVYITEDADQVERIMYGICKHENLKEPVEGFNYWFKIVNARRQKCCDLSDLIAELRTECSVSLGYEFNNYVTEPLIVLDTSNATIDLDNENDNAEAGKVIASIKESMGKCAIWLVAHTSKIASKDDIDQMSARGAGAFEGDANAVAYLLNIDGQRFLTLGKRRFECDFTDIKFDSYSDSEQVLTPWGQTQTVRYRYGIPCISSMEERKEVKESGATAAKIATRIKLRLKILQVLSDEGDMPLSQLKSHVKGKGTIVTEVVEELIKEKLLTEFVGARNARLIHVVNPRPHRSS